MSDNPTTKPFYAPEMCGQHPHDVAWNAAIGEVHRIVSEAAAGRGPLWDGVENGGEVLDRLPNAIWEMRRGS